MTGWAASALTAGRLTDGRMQFWATDANGQIWSTWQNGYDWVYWQHQWTPALPPLRATNLAVAPLSDGRLQFWAVDTSGKIWSCWKSTTAANASWTAWTSTWTPQAPPFRAVQVAAAPLSDGRLQFWAVDTNGAIWSCWKSGTSSSASWTNWTNAWTAVPPFRVRQVAAGRLSDGRLQFFAVDTAGAIWSCWKSTTASSASWTAWTRNWIADVPAFTTRALCTAAFGDGRLAVWAIDTTGEIWTTIKSTAASGAAWQNWALAFSMEKQEQTNWCWAGCGNGTSHFYDPASTWKQCTLADAEIPATNCCGNPAPCNVYGYLDKALSVVGHFDHYAGGTVPDATITSETAGGRPMGVRIAWSGGGAHFIMLSGGGPNAMVTVKDPWYGASYIPYATLVSGYQGTGSWTHSYWTK